MKIDFKYFLIIITLLFTLTAFVFVAEKNIALQKEIEQQSKTIELIKDKINKKDIKCEGTWYDPLGGYGYSGEKKESYHLPANPKTGEPCYYK